MSAPAENCTKADAVFEPGPMDWGAGMRCATSWDIMTLVGRAILLGIVILAPGGLLLLPLLAAHQWKKTQKSNLAHAH